MPHWHDFNPWATMLVYLPDLDELSACLDPFNPERKAKHWLEAHGPKLDAYIIPTVGGNHSVGVRYGAKVEEYYSPYCHPAISSLLLSKYDVAVPPQLPK